MYLVHESTIKTESGMYEVTVFIVHEDVWKKYTYLIPSDYAVSQFYKLYTSGRKMHGKALTVLNKFKVKGEII